MNNVIGLGIVWAAFFIYLKVKLMQINRKKQANSNLASRTNPNDAWLGSELCNKVYNQQ